MSIGIGTVHIVKPTGLVMHPAVVRGPTRHNLSELAGAEKHSPRRWEKRQLEALSPEHESFIDGHANYFHIYYDQYGRRRVVVYLHDIIPNWRFRAYAGLKVCLDAENCKEFSFN